MSDSSHEAESYKQLAEKLEQASETLWLRVPNHDLHATAELWAFGLRQLGDAREHARAAFEPVAAAMRESGAEHAGRADLDMAYRSYRRAHVAEQYHELALVALSQPLWEAVAVTYLSFPDGLPQRPVRDRHDPWWPAFEAILDEAPADSAVRALVRAARRVDVMVVPARSRLVAHQLPGHVPVYVRDAEGRLVRTGRVEFASGELAEHAHSELIAVNAALPRERRSTQTNRFKLARDVATSADAMEGRMRRRYERAARDLGFEFAFVDAAVALIDLVEALADWSADLRPGRA